MEQLLRLPLPMRTRQRARQLDYVRSWCEVAKLACSQFRRRAPSTPFKMGTVILLSSSPPRPFARSPTPAGSSSPAFASPSSIFGNGQKGFKTATVQRDGFAGRFSTARSILGTKFGSENIPFGVTKTQQSPEKVAKEIPSKPKSLADPQGDGDRPRVKHSKSIATAEPSAEDTGKKQSAMLASTGAAAEDPVASIFINETNIRPKSGTLSPLMLDKALSRRLDWTPPKASSESMVEPELEARPPGTSFPRALIESFNYEGTFAQSSFSSRSNEEGAATKRRRLDLVDNGLRKLSKDTAVPQLVLAPEISTIAPAKPSKSPKKKHTTITGLATSHYFGEDQREAEARPMLQYLAATQIRDIGDTEEPPLDATKRKRASKKPKTRKKSLPKSVLLSPESAMKAVDSQDLVFGSASQLARNESPTFIRDIVEATKQSESSVSCTPVPTQVTIPSEPGSATPRGLKGTSRFTRSRNLWASASRDEDNALLQVETIDLLDSPDLRLAFTGKDAMLQPTAPRHRELASPENASPALKGRHLARPDFVESNGWLDIDDIGISTPRAHVITKSFAQTRTMHSASGPLGKRAKSPLDTGDLCRPGAKRNSLTDGHEVQVETLVPVGASRPTESPRFEMPIFSGLTTGELSNQIKKYGFKPFRKREKMIEVLQNCWEAEHKLKAGCISKRVAEDVPDEGAEAATHGGILSKVHGLAARPVPKVSKAKVPRPKKDKLATPTKPATQGAAAKADKDAGKDPKRRKNAEPNVNKTAESTTEKVPRKRKAKATALPGEHVIDISDTEDSIHEGPDKAPALLTAAGTKLVSDTASQPATRLATPPPVAPATISSEFESSTPTPLETRNPDLPEINSQITEAITKYVASPTRDHQRDPTWHEKILMYDPIVLEDLAAWLNMKGLGLIGEDREVSAFEVRTWCEMKGVCCYGVGGGWRGNVKGKTKTRVSEVED